MHHVSIIVLTHNRRHELLHTLDKLHGLEAPYAIYVVDNASTDDSAAAVLERHPDCRVIRLRRNIGAAGRNAGVAAARTLYVAFWRTGPRIKRDGFLSAPGRTDRVRTGG